MLRQPALTKFSSNNADDKNLRGMKQHQRQQNNAGRDGGFCLVFSTVHYWR
jgi:hypothetical protein